MKAAPVQLAPHNIEAERAILGAALFDADAFPRVRILESTDFYLDEHAQVYEAMRRLHDAGRAIDSVTVKHELERVGALDAVGGPAGLALLMEEAAIAAHVDEYVRDVRGLATKRMAAGELERVRALAMNGTEAADVADAIRALDASLRARISAPTQPEVVREGLDLALIWPAGIRFELTAIRDTRSGVKGDLTVLQAGRRRHWGEFNLSTPGPREALRKNWSA